MKNRALKYISIAGFTLALGSGAWWVSRTAHRAHAPKLVYSPAGYGGFVPAPAKGASPIQAAAKPTQSTVQAAKTAYNARNYQQAEVIAEQTITHVASQKTAAARREVVDARDVLAYAAARRHDLKTARERFTVLRQEAAKLPDKGAQAPVPGSPQPTLEQDAAYQHAVCTAALGDKKAAESEYLAFMKTYPDSPLISAALARISKMHGGDTPPATLAVWRHATQVAQARDNARQREQALCGPECFAELLRRRGEHADVHQLADEMHTDKDGTTLQALAKVAQKRGFAAQGMALTPRGLQQQKMPVIALISSGHYVVVDKVSSAQVTVWDPDAYGAGKSALQEIPSVMWRRAWDGMALVMQK